MWGTKYILLWQSQINPEDLDFITGLINEAITQGSQVTPAGIVGYSFAVLVLMITNWVTYREKNKAEASWKESIDYNKDVTQQVIKYNQKTLELMVRIETRLNDQQGYGEIIKDVGRDVQEIKSGIAKLEDKIV